MFACCQSRGASQSVEEEPISFDSPSWDRQNSSSDYVHGVRTTFDESVPASKALEKLRAGNARFATGVVAPKTIDDDTRQALATHGQNPMAAVVGCADSRCPIETLFDVKPGDLFVLRNAGNTITHAEGSMVGSLEYCVGNLKTNLVVVLGHTRCGAIAGATNGMLLQQNAGSKDGPSQKSTLEILLRDLGPVARQAQSELPAGAASEEIAAHAVKVNVFHTIEKLLTYSEPLREKVRGGEVQVHGAIYDIVSGKVEFLGQSSRQALLLGSQAMLVPRKPLAVSQGVAQNIGTHVGA